MRSGMAFLELELDIWATYLLQVKFGEMYVERCNRAIFPTGLSNMPDFTINAPTYRTLPNFTATNENLAIVYLCAFKSQINLFDNSLTDVALFGNALNEITTPGSITEERSFENICATIGGVYGVHKTIASFDYTTDACVLAAYIVPLAMLENIYDSYSGGWTNAPTLKSKSVYGESNFNPHILCKPGIKSKIISIPANPTQSQSVGTRTQYMLLPRSTSSLNVEYQFITKNDGIAVTVCCGDKVLDITDSFRLTLTTADDGYNTGEKIANALNLVNVAASAKAGPMSFATTAAGYIAGRFSDASPRITSGDAATTFYNNSVTSYNSPYILTTYTSNSNIEHINRNFGAEFNSIYIQPLAKVFDSALLGSAPPSSTYIKGDIDCYGAQSDILDYFIQRFREGVYLEKI